MEAINFNALFFNHEIPFCKVYSVESKDKLEKLLLTNRISFFVEWQEKKLWQRFLGNANSGKNEFTIRINEADSVLANDLLEGIDCVKLGAV
ncbi:MAG: hypothetical protein K2L82_02430 [Lachnospiraceae bacterium]|nr:hypothetical protein [Lachnospiraceae bacterium]